MTKEKDIQLALLSAIREKLPPGTPLADYVADQLKVSKDSAYRRIRGEKEFSFEEVVNLGMAARISLDDVLLSQDERVMFMGSYIEEGRYSFTDFLRDLLDQLVIIANTPGSHLIYQNKDISFFYYLMFPDLLAFKYYIWMSQHFGFRELGREPFDFSCVGETNLSLAREISRTFVQIPSTEIMNPDNVLTDLRQVEYFKATGKFQSTDDMNRVYDALEQLVSHLEHQSQSGKKFLPGQSPQPEDREITVYVHDFHYGDNEAIVLLDGSVMTVFTHTAINVMRSYNEAMGKYSHAFLMNMIGKSTLISGVGEKFRTRFFNGIRETIHRFRNDEVLSLLP